MTISGNYSTESIFTFRKPSIDRLVGNNLFRFHPYRYCVPDGRWRFHHCAKLSTDVLYKVLASEHFVRCDL
jgi:hypothetical protein